ncbi:MAG: hypothetical protein UY48_C0003G0002 [Candidatus Gottesmanbacteria bacterium GW2011_GWB1_49_7]|uniref:Uncharacterized protein n=1 Tax=Candidatus Gottesmanbacteria bacterium GW2011_GWB1_49_7 TaxID=1618448 RepID=A0A0G1W3P3_9BACT|nr:MAG: hypothetical protein UY48_C0003G0002 [Candidatus Gottesmanbacteria bacterium GW2011_GWB1_49_7]
MTLRDRIVAQLADTEGKVYVTADEADIFITDEGWHTRHVDGYDPSDGGPTKYGFHIVSKDGRDRHSIPVASTMRRAMLQTALYILDL